MNTINLAGNNQGLNELKKDAQKAQKKGLPFIMSSVLIRTIETVGNVQEVGAVGAALVVAAGIKKVDVLEFGR